MERIEREAYVRRHRYGEVTKERKAKHEANMARQTLLLQLAGKVLSHKMSIPNAAVLGGCSNRAMYRWVSAAKSGRITPKTVEITAEM
jgi:hypothetical protein